MAQARLHNRYMIAGLIVLAAAGLVVCGCRRSATATGAAHASVAQLLQMGRKYADAGSYNDAYYQFTRAALADPSSFEANFQAAKACLKLADVEAGQKWIERALKLKPDSAEAYHLRGELYLLAGRFEQAARDFRKASRLDPQLLAARLNLVTALMGLGRYRQALEAAKEAVKLAPDDPSAHYAVGNVLERMNDTAGAEKEYRRALEFGPASLQLAMLLTREKRDLDYARELAKRAEEIDPADGLAAATAGYALYLMGYQRDGLTEILGAANRHPYNAELWKMAATVAAEAGYPEVAKQCRQRALLARPSRMTMATGGSSPFSGTARSSPDDRKKRQ